MTLELKAHFTEGKVFVLLCGKPSLLVRTLFHRWRCTLLSILRIRDTSSPSVVKYLNYDIRDFILFNGVLTFGLHISLLHFPNGGVSSAKCIIIHIVIPIAVNYFLIEYIPNLVYYPKFLHIASSYFFALSDQVVTKKNLRSIEYLTVQN